MAPISPSATRYTLTLRIRGSELQKKGGEQVKQETEVICLDCCLQRCGLCKSCVIQLELK